MAYAYQILDALGGSTRRLVFMRLRSGAPSVGAIADRIGPQPPRGLPASEDTQSSTLGDGPRGGNPEGLRGGPERNRLPAQWARWILGPGPDRVQRARRTGSSQRNKNHEEKKKEKS